MQKKESRKKTEWVTVISEAVDTRLKSDDAAPSEYAISIINKRRRVL